MILWLNNKFMTAQEIRASIKDNYSVIVDPERLSAQLGALLDANAVIMNQAQMYKITEESRHSLEKELEAGRDVEDQTRQLFFASIIDAGLDIDPEGCWDTFQDRCLIPLVRDMGAHTYEFITSGNQPIDKVFEYTDKFFATYDPLQEQALRRAIVSFLSPGNGAVRDFVLRTLDNAFFIEASGLQKEALERLTVRLGQRTPLKLFLDTNLLFSLLDLHDNPSDESAQSLMALLHQTVETIPWSLHVLPSTVGEFTRTLAFYRDILTPISVSPNIAVASQRYGRISGVTHRYMRACEEAGKPINVTEFFRPYISSPLVVMRQKSVSIYDAKTDTYSLRQDVVDDINEFWERVDPKQKSEGRYNSIKHDMILRHLVNDKRPAYIESPLEAEYWVATIDYQLLRFDRHRASVEGRVPVCIDPASLVRILQLWLPRADALETAMFESVRVPFRFRGFDTESEIIALKILETLSRFENVEDLSIETITHLLIDDATRDRMSGAKDKAAEEDVIRESLKTSEANLRAELEQARDMTERYKLQATEQKHQIDLLSREMERSAKLQSATSETEVGDGDSNAKLNYLVKWVIAPSAASSISVILLVIATFVLTLRLAPVIAGIAIVVGVGIVLGLADWRGRSVSGLERLGLYRWIQNSRKWLYGILGALLVSMVGRVLWEYLGLQM